MSKRALIVVDVQPTFCENGALAVEGGNKVAENIGQFLLRHGSEYDVIATTQDWHNPPPDDNSGHFALDGEPNFSTSWPVHGVAGTAEAAIHPAVEAALPEETFRFLKGQGRDDYSGFQAVLAEDETLALAAVLLAHGVQYVDVVGLAADYCVPATALDAVEWDFETAVLTDLTAGVAISSTVAALTSLSQAGVSLELGIDW